MTSLNSLATPAELEHLAYELDQRQLCASIAARKTIDGATLILISGISDFDDVVVSLNSQAQPCIYCLTDPIPDDIAADVAEWVTPEEKSCSTSAH